MDLNQINNQLIKQLSNQSDDSTYLNDHQFLHQYQNINDLQTNNYQIPINEPINIAQLKRNQFGQKISKSFPIQNTNHHINQSKYFNDNNLKKEFQPNLALHKINGHLLASNTPKIESNVADQQNGGQQSKSSFKQLPRFCRTQSTTSAISLQSIRKSGSLMSNGNLINNLNSNLINNSNSNVNINNNNRISNLSSYTNTPPLPLNSTTLNKQITKRNTQSSLNYSIQSFKSNYLASLPENYLNGLELNGIESTTSSSYLHGFILSSIILLSIIAFILIKFQDACEEYYLHLNSNTCYQTSQFFFTFMLLFTCLFAFITYFLHLIGQCDYLNLMAKKKVFTEILITCLVTFCLLLSSLILIITTVALYHWISTSSLIISFIVCIFYKVRIYLLYREYRMLNDKPQIDSTEMCNNFNENRLNQQLNFKINQQQINLQFNKRFSLQSNQFKDHLKDDEIDDDVFG